MHARSTTIRGRPESVDEGIAFCRDEVLPMCRELPGCMGLSMIVDREIGPVHRHQLMGLDRIHASDDHADAPDSATRRRGPRRYT